MYVRTKIFSNKDGTKRTYLYIVEVVRQDPSKNCCQSGCLGDMQEGMLNSLNALLAKSSHKKWIQAESRKADRP